MAQMRVVFARMCRRPTSRTPGAAHFIARHCGGAAYVVLFSDPMSAQERLDQVATVRARDWWPTGSTPT